MQKHILIILVALTAWSCYFETKHFIYDPFNEYRLFNQKPRVLNRLRKIYGKTQSRVIQEYGIPDYVSVMSLPEGGVFYTSAYWLPKKKEIALLAFMPEEERYLCTSVTYMPKHYWSPEGFRKP